ncbi:hypothetical protein L596_017139 [Steinernema carpocapsae]|uniref:Uncharacterized protein n=1 Tax=Steinernema carpocapsae TaxID=34508 RepID=A0A4U5N103_STECR|nr:hypothetical protein L596_017139 [Steinernema carpocapsae]
MHIRQRRGATRPIDLGQIEITQNAIWIVSRDERSKRSTYIFVGAARRSGRSVGNNEAMQSKLRFKA